MIPGREPETGTARPQVVGTGRWLADERCWLGGE